MRIAVVALDTRGGVQPYTALALGLRDAGHEAIMLVPGEAVPDVAVRGVPTIALTTSDARDAARGVAEMSPLARLRFMRRHMHETIGRAAVTARDACADADVVTAGIGGMAVGTAVAEKIGRPFVAAHLQPLGPATGAFPGPLLRPPPPWLGRVGNRPSHRLTALGLRAMFGQAAGRARAVLGLPGRPAPTDPRLPVLYGFSPLVVPHPPEWGRRRHITGYWTLPAPGGWTPPPDLAAFLAAGPSPVCVGFGSMVGRDPVALSRLVVRAARGAGLRAVLLTGWGGLAARTVGDDVFVTDHAPHDWLLPRCAAVVHHGGAGTTGAALAAGTPAVVVPFAADQHFWAGRTTALGAGPAPIPRRRLTADRLAQALLAATTDPRLRAAATVLATRLRDEHGVQTAVEHFAALDGFIPLTY